MQFDTVGLLGAEMCFADKLETIEHLKANNICDAKSARKLLRMKEVICDQPRHPYE